MDILINLCGKYRKWIYAVLTIALFLLLCFPIIEPYTLNAERPANNLIKVPFFISLLCNGYYLQGIGSYEMPQKNIAIFELCESVFFFIFLVLIVMFWILEAKNRKMPFCLVFIPVFITYMLSGFYYELSGFQGSSLNALYALKFNMPVPLIVLIILICLYAFAVLFGKLYPRMQPKVAETVGKVADKVKPHKSKSERIEELERQNAEIQRQLDELKRKD